jgi:hypothetical protein
MLDEADTPTLSVPQIKKGFKTVADIARSVEDAYWAARPK